MTEQENSIQRAAKVCGGGTALAKALGLTAPCVYQWLNGTRPVPAERCRAIEAACGGKVTRYELRPDVFGESPEQAAA